MEKWTATLCKCTGFARPPIASGQGWRNHCTPSTPCPRTTRWAAATRGRSPWRSGWRPAWRWCCCCGTTPSRSPNSVHPRPPGSRSQPKVANRLGRSVQDVILKEESIELRCICGCQWPSPAEGERRWWGWDFVLLQAGNRSSGFDRPRFHTWVFIMYEYFVILPNNDNQVCLYLSLNQRCPARLTGLQSRQSLASVPQGPKYKHSWHQVDETLLLAKSWNWISLKRGRKKVIKSSPPISNISPEHP